MPTPSKRTTVLVVVTSAVLIGLMGVYRFASDPDPPPVVLAALPSVPSTTTTSPTSTSTTTTTVAPPPVVRIPRLVPANDADADEEDEATTTTVDRDPVRDGRDEWGNRRYVDPVSRDLAYLVDGRGARIELDDYEALRWGFYDRYGNWVLAADVLRGG